MFIIMAPRHTAIGLLQDQSTSNAFLLGAGLLGELMVLLLLDDNEASDPLGRSFVSHLLFCEFQVCIVYMVLWYVGIL